MNMGNRIICLITLFIITGCASTPAVIKRLDVPQGTEIAIIAFRDCTIAGQADCYGSGNVAGSIFARVLSTASKFSAVPLSRPVGPNEVLTDDVAVDFARTKGFQFVLNGEVDEYYSVAPMTFRLDRAGISIRLLRVIDGSVAAFFSQRKDAATNFETPDGLIEQMAIHVRNSLDNSNVSGHKDTSGF